MKLTHVLQSRPAWWDRNPVITGIDYNAQVGPHAQTTRATYTAPGGKKALITSQRAGLIRAAVAGTVGFADAVTQIDVAVVVDMLVAGLLNNVTGDREYLGTGQAGLLASGDVVRILTSDQSITGNHIFDVGVTLTEFDS